MANLLARYQGCLVGAVVGDCIGAVYEGLSNVAIEDVVKLTSKIESSYSDEKQSFDSSKETPVRKNRPKYSFTDDTAMARSVAVSLITCKGLDACDLAKRFAEAFDNEPYRGYGGAVTRIFPHIADPNIKDVFAPAREQFDGQGSYGNGGAMRIAPAGVFCHCQKYDFQKMKDLVSQITRLTHSHINAIHGAVLQCLAVATALDQNPDKPMDSNEFLDKLLLHIKPLEEEEGKKELSSDQDNNSEKLPSSSENRESKLLTYTSKLNKMKEFLNQDTEDEVIVEVLGNDISALDSVPTAIYCFLRATKDIPAIEGQNAFQRTVIYATSLGGDTDTIATMAAAIAGSVYGIEAIPDSWRSACEGTKDAAHFARQFYEIRVE